MKVSKRWFDNGSHTVPKLPVDFSTNCAVHNNGEQYTVTITLNRQNQNEKRAGLHDTEHLRVEMNLEEARRFAKIISEKIETLEYYSKNACWPSINGRDPNRGLKPLDR